MYAGRPRAARPRPIGPKGSSARPSLLRSPSHVCARSEGDDVMASASNPCPATADAPSLGEPALTLREGVALSARPSTPITRMILLARASADRCQLLEAR